MMSSPEQFIVYKSEGANWLIKFKHPDGQTEEMIISYIPKGIEPNKWYGIYNIFNQQND